MVAFEPEFKEVSCLDELAHQINIHHEDFPKRVEVTKQVLRLKIGELEKEREANKPYSICALIGFDICQIHSVVMWDLPSRGRWRMKEVLVGRESTCPPHLIADELFEQELFPVSIRADLVDWYRRFQIIHPFEDGNGRVGGIVVGVLHYLNTGKYLAPCQ